jgi:hypothetical protein
MGTSVIGSRLVVASLTAVALTSVAHAQPPGMTEPQPVVDAPAPAQPDEGRDIDRVMFGAGVAVFANYPMSIEDPGFALFASRPLWLGNRYRYWQWVAEANALVGFGTEKNHAYAGAGPAFGFNLYLGSVFGLEFRWGAAGILQVGARTEPGIAVSGCGGYVFRLWHDDRKRLKLWMQEYMGAYFAPDPGNDAPMAGAFSWGLAYEQPL